MKKSFQKKWIEALLSDKYPQTRGVLRSDRGYCCLGVACDLIDPTGWLSPRIMDYCIDGRDHEILAQGWHSTRPKSVKDLAFEICIEQHDIYTLAEMNDVGRSFKEIAAYVGKLPAEDD